MKADESYHPFLYALTIWREFRGESYEAKLAGAWVIRNRMRDAQRRWPATPAEVVLQRLQFSCFNPFDVNAVLLPRLGDKAWAECCQAVDEATAGETADPSGGANHYHALPEGKEPSWAHPLKLTKIIGRTRFYRL